jgi:molybdopterin-guanine dinucleotide biosynthesis protein A
MGMDKAWLKLGSRSIIENIVGVLTPLFERLRIISDESERFRSLDIPVQRDLVSSSGPLGGIHAALSTALADAVFVTACDFPFLNADFVQGLLKLLGNHDAVVPHREGRAVPVCGVYSLRCLPAVEKDLKEGRLKTVSFSSNVDTRWVEGYELDALDPEGLALMNLNTQEDYARAKALVEARPSILPI